MNKKSRVLYLSYEGLTDDLGQSQILPYLKGLSKNGHDITVITFDKANRYKNEGKTIMDSCIEDNIHWISKPYTKKPAILSTLKDLRSLEKDIIQLHDQKAFNLIHCRSYLTSLIGLRIKRKMGIPFIFDMRGFYADERVDGKIWNLSNPLYQKIYDYFKVKEHDLLEEADAIVSLTHEGKHEIENWYIEKELYGGGEYWYNYDRAQKVQNKITVIPCVSDLDHFDYRRISENKKRWLSAVHGIDPDLEYLGYVGSLGTWYMAKEMLLLYKVLLESNSRLRFLILSHDSLGFLRQEADRLKIPQSYLIQVAAQRKEVPVLMSLMSASVFFILPAYSKKASSPTKQGELMAMGVPIICNSGIGDSDQMIINSKSGVVIKNFDEQAFKAVAKVWYKIVASPKQKIRDAAIEFFDLTKGINKYESIYKQILQ